MLSIPFHECKNFFPRRIRDRRSDDDLMNISCKVIYTLNRFTWIRNLTVTNKAGLYYHYRKQSERFLYMPLDKSVSWGARNETCFPPLVSFFHCDFASAFPEKVSLTFTIRIPLAFISPMQIELAEISLCILFTF